MQKKRSQAYTNNFKSTTRGNGRRTSPSAAEKRKVKVAKRRKIIRFKKMTTAELESHLHGAKGKKLPARARRKKK